MKIADIAPSRDNIAPSDVIPALALLACAGLAPLHAAESIHALSVTPQRDYAIVIGLGDGAQAHRKAGRIDIHFRQR